MIRTINNPPWYILHRRDLRFLGTALFFWSAAFVVLGWWWATTTWVGAQRVWCEEQGAIYVYAEGVDKYMCAKPVKP